MKLSPRVKDYLTSERFIHDSLVSFVDELAGRLRGLSQKGEKLRPLLLFWVNEKIKGDDGGTINDKVVMEFDDIDEVRQHMLYGVERTKAYAVLFFQPNEDNLRLDLETPHGAETWQMKRQRRGDSYFIGAPVRSSGASIFGVIPNKLN
jgi:hypothetical protein